MDKSRDKRKIRWAWWLVAIIGVLTAITFLCSVGAVGAFVFLPTATITNHNFPFHQKWHFVADSDIQGAPVTYADRILFRTKHYVYAVDNTTGNQIWSTALRKNLYAVPLLVANGVVVVSSSWGTVALNIDDGTHLWQTSENTGKTSTYPADANQDVVVIVGDFVSIHTLDTGKTLWRIPAPGRSTGLAFIKDNQVITIFNDEIRGYDLKTGELLWDNTGGWSPLSGAIHNGVLYLDHNEGIGAFDIGTQKTLWVNQDRQSNNKSITVEDELLLLGTANKYPTALRLNDGEIVWEADGVNQLDTYQKPLVVGKKIYLRSLFDNRLYALSLSDGSMIGYLQLGPSQLFVANAEYPSGPINSNGNVIFPVNEVLYAYGA